MMKFKLSGKLASGKNQIQIAVKNGRIMKYPNARFKEWHSASLKQILCQRVGLYYIFENPVHLSVQYVPGDLIRRDATGMLDALFRLLEDAHVVKDDSQIKSISWFECPLDRNKPSAEITVSARNI